MPLSFALHNEILEVNKWSKFKLLLSDVEPDTQYVLSTGWMDGRVGGWIDE